MLNLVTDRTNNDVTRLQRIISTKKELRTEDEQAELDSHSSKGAYNYTDLNRVTEAMDYINERLTALGYVTGYQRIVVHPDSGGSRLPDGYTELEYIKSTGTQYIDTGYKPNSNTRVIVKAYFATSNTAHWLFGARDGNAVAAYGFLTYQNYYRSDYGSETGNLASSSFPASFIIDKNKDVTMINTDDSVTTPSSNFQCSYNLYLFANNNGGTVAGFCKAAIYSVEIFENDVKLLNFIPCKNSESVIGFYDTIGKQFYANAGTGEFVAGQVISTTGISGDNMYRWLENDIPTPSQLQQYLTNIQRLRDTLSEIPNTPMVPESMRFFGFSSANDIEKILEKLSWMLDNMQRNINLGWVLGIADIGLYGGI